MMSQIPSAFRPVLFGFFVFFLFTCGPPKPEVDRAPIVKSVCEFDRVIPNSITATQVIDRSIIYGNASNTAAIELPGVWGAIYATKESVATETETRVGQQCFPVFVCNYWGQCGYVPQCGPVEYQTESYTDISHLYGVGRAPSRFEAEDLALENCEAAVDAFQRESDEYISYSARECVKLITQYCG